MFCLLLLLLAAGQKVQGERISQRKCEEYRNDTIALSLGIPLTLEAEPLVFTTFNCTKSVDLIVGGEEAKEGEFPHQALLGWRFPNGSTGYDFRCGASLISERFILTAAHCLKNGDPDIVRLGALDLTVESDIVMDLEIDSIRRHPEHRFSKSYHDIALLRLKRNVPSSQYIRPACLWDKPVSNLTSVIATGFGYTEFLGEKMSNTLRKVQLDFLDASECVEQYGSRRNFDRGIQPEQLCIGSTRGGRDACQGDSGGPVQIITEPKGCTYHLVGITSTGVGCGEGRSPSIYTSVTSYLDWIEGVVWGA